ncbi:hypothetical protein PIB30_030636 [Stylosanthes scabra]|uniref:Protein kinase domain-containing protein n=1 Tax=Stylosanthes scabra TaxID=79078 RepID=A0ABU6YAB1_9FABA|nr:hypothetical protein [Stylosanthes scabra]
MEVNNGSIGVSQSMTIGRDLQNGLEWRLLTSWKSIDDPSPGLKLLDTQNTKLVQNIDLSGCKALCSREQDLYIRMSASELEKSKMQEYMKGYADDTDLSLFDLLTINIATEKFSLNNKIGQGGFGLVYKEKLAHGQEIAVKKLSPSSGQEMAEFITEIKQKSKLLDWPQRFHIIFGVVRGFLYLHQDYRLRIIH